MLQISSDCTKCAKCVKVCPTSIIEMTDNGPLLKPERIKGCIKCGHCVSVCDKGALDHQLVSLANQESTDNVITSPEAVKATMRSVRSIRNYRKTPVSKELIADIADAARYVPTARNTQQVSYLAVLNPETVKLLADKTVDYFAEAIEAGEPWVRPYRGLVRVYRDKGYDIVFRGAPHVLISVYPKSQHYGEDNARLGMVYARLQASVHNIGTCWAGFFEMYAVAKPEEVAEILKIDADMRVGAAVMFGHPAFKYHRLVEREPLNISFI